MELFDDIEQADLTASGKNPREFKLHVAVVKHIETAFFCYFFHVPNQNTSAKSGFFLKMMGVKPGVSDLVIIWKGGVGFLELKAPDGHLSTPQSKFLGAVESFGCKIGVAKSVKQAHDTLCKWGLVPRHSAIREPDYRTLQEKHKDAIRLFAPEGK